MNYSVSRRTREIGIRVSLGANRADVLRMVLGQGMMQAAAGSAFGVAGALLLSRFIAKMLYGVPPTDSVTFSGVAVVLGAAALLASGAAARKAIRIEPMVALRSE
jgi:putative ABC transport system permease protein